MKPMLAAATTGENLNYPAIISPKLDGVRCIIADGVVLSRSLKPIPNKYVQKLFGQSILNGFDGELIVGHATDKDVYTNTVSGVMSIDGEPDVRFHIFDDVSANYDFMGRLTVMRRRLNALQRNHHTTFGALCGLVPQTTIHDQEELMKYEESYLRQGYEGVMIKSPIGWYKFGRSTLKEGLLLKLKRFEDSEAEIIGFSELMSNTNEATTNELGQKTRSSKKLGLVPANTLGALQVRDLKTGVEFEIGTGFSAAQRIQLWSKRLELLGELIKYKSQPVGVKDKPRFPVFIGFRNKIDM